MWAQESGQLSDVGAGVQVATVQWDSHVSGPLSGPPSSGSLFYLPLVYLVIKLKPYSGRRQQQILLYVGCPHSMAHPGVAKVVAIVSNIAAHFH